MSVLDRRGTLSLLLIGLTAVPLLAQPAVPRVEYANPIAGFALTIPEDWEMASGDLGNLFIAIDAPVAYGLCSTQPVLWFFYTQKAPQQMAQELAKSLQQLDGAPPQVRTITDKEAYEVSATSNGPRGPLVERWLCRRQAGISYVLGAMVRPQFAEQYRQDIETALTSCHLIHRRLTKRFVEPTENAYRLALPRDWKWEGQVLRAEGVPGYFVWKVQSPDGLNGAFSAPPGTFNISVPYLPAGQAASVLVLPSLQQQVPGVRLERVHELPRAGAFFTASLKALGLGEHPQVHKVRADYRAEVEGTPIRIRVDIVTLMLDASPLLGGRGNWMMMASGAWAPVEDFSALYPVGRGVIASLRTDPRFRNAQFEAVNEVLLVRGWWRRFYDWAFIVDYLDLVDTINIPSPPPPPPDED